MPGRTMSVRRHTGEPMSPCEKLGRLIERAECTVAIIGLGYVGLPLAHALHAGGLRILGLDTDPRKIDALAKGHSYIRHFGDDLVRTLSSSDRFRATGDLGRLGEADVIIVTVPTPLGPHQEPDLSFVL